MLPKLSVLETSNESPYEHRQYSYQTLGTDKDRPAALINKAVRNAIAFDTAATAADRANSGCWSN